MAEFVDEKGLSLLEVLVAMFMVALISSSLMGGFLISSRMIKQAAQIIRASNYAYAIIEDLRARPAEDWAKIAADQGYVSEQLSGGQADSSVADLQASISMAENAELAALYDVRVCVQWSDGGKNRELEMVTRLNSQLRAVGHEN